MTTKKGCILNVKLQNGVTIYDGIINEKQLSEGIGSFEALQKVTARKVKHIEIFTKNKASSFSVQDFMDNDVPDFKKVLSCINVILY